MTSGTFAPNIAPKRLANMPATSMKTLDGSMKRPAWVTLAPNP